MPLTLSAYTHNIILPCRCRPYKMCANYDKRPVLVNIYNYISTLGETAEEKKVRVGKLSDNSAAINIFDN